jgi:hypothetical protein
MCENVQAPQGAQLPTALKPEPYSGNPLSPSAPECGTARLERPSRRRRLWELGHACHCPLVGVGMPL